MKRLAVKLTYANVMATVALFLALGGGTVYAATKMLPKNSVGAAQLKKGAVTPAKLSKATDQALRGPAGPTGPQGTPGKEGAPGVNLTATTTLPSGTTETGNFSVAGGGAPAFLAATADFVQPLPATLDGSHIELLRQNQTSGPHCPGPGVAAPGYLCAYTVEEGNIFSVDAAADPETGKLGAGRSGAVWFFEVKSAAEDSFAYGTWAVTAP